jgi:cytochrome c-type biogenesis protein CcmF
MWPLVAEMFFDRKLSVGPPFFNAAFTPFMVALGLILPLGSVLPWKRAALGRTARRLRYAFVLALAGAGRAWAMHSGRSLLGPMGMFLGAWLVAGVAVELWQRTGRGGDRLRRLRHLPRADWGKAVAHAGLGVTMAGVAGLTAWAVDDIRAAPLGETWQVGGYSLTLNAVEEVRGPNYLSTMANIGLSKDGAEIATLRPEKRFYPVARMPTTEAAIHYNLARDVYVVIGDEQQGGGWTVRTYIKPMTNWIWIGCALMALGGLLSLSDRRFRVAAGAGKAAPVPAE